MMTIGSMIGIHFLLTIVVEFDQRTLRLGNAIAEYSAVSPEQISGYWLAIAVIVGWIASVCLHEFGHAIVAYWGGDTTVKDKGYLTLNPLKYTDIGYSLALPVVFLILGGIALPGAAVYINHTLLRSRAWNSAVSAAGPLMTGGVAIALSLPFQWGWANDDGWFWSALALLASYQVAALCFNLFPVPSFDGFGILEPWLSKPLQKTARRWGRYGYLALFAILWTVPDANRAFWSLVNGISQILGIPNDKISAAYLMFAQPSKIVFIGLLLGALIFRTAFGSTFNQPTENDDLAINLAAYDRLIQEGKATANIWWHKGEILQSLERKEEAVAAFEAALVEYDRELAKDPKNSEIWTHKARILTSLKRPQEAVEAYDQSLKYAPSDLDNWHDRGLLLYYDLEDYVRAQSSFKCILKSQPSNVKAIMLHSLALEKLGRTDEALEGYDKVLTYNPNDSNGWKIKLLLLLDLKRYEEALQDLRKSLKRFPKDSFFWINQGIVLEKVGRESEALNSYDRAIQLDPTDSHPWINKILLLEQLDRNPEALELIETAQEQFPQEISLWFYQGNAYYSLKEYDLAIDAYDQCLQNKYAEAEAHYNKACCYALQGHSDLAIAALTEVLNSGNTALLAQARDNLDLQSLHHLESFQALVHPIPHP
jgi:tetratricopeptide (TPR) repeat protein